MRVGLILALFTAVIVARPQEDTLDSLPTILQSSALADDASPSDPAGIRPQGAGDLVDVKAKVDLDDGRQNDDLVRVRARVGLGHGHRHRGHRHRGHRHRGYRHRGHGHRGHGHISDECDSNSDCTSPTASHFAPGICKEHRCHYSECTPETGTTHDTCSTKRWCQKQSSGLFKCVEGCRTTADCSSKWTCDTTSHSCKPPTTNKCSPFRDTCGDGTYCDSYTETCEKGCGKKYSACKVMGKSGICDDGHKCIVPTPHGIGSPCSMRRDDCGPKLRCVARIGLRARCHPVAAEGAACNERHVMFNSVCPRDCTCKRNKCEKMSN